jgi:hypothetical protein
MLIGNTGHHPDTGTEFDDRAIAIDQASNGVALRRLITAEHEQTLHGCRDARVVDAETATIDPHRVATQLNELTNAPIPIAPVQQESLLLIS